MPPIRVTLALAMTVAVLSMPMAGCTRGWWWGTPEGLIKYSLKPYEPPVMAAMTGAAPVPWVPDPPRLKVNPVTGVVTNADTGAPVRGTLMPLPGEMPVASSDPRTVITTIDGLRANYIDVGNTLLVETSGLTPRAKYTAVMTWPNGRKTARAISANAAGNIETPYGEPYLEYPHSGFFRLQVKSTEPSIITGQYKVEIAQEGQATEQTLYYTVRARPIVFITDDKYVDAVHFFTDQPARIFIHGEGFKPHQTVHVWVLNHDIGHLSPLKDGITLKDKVFDKLENLSFSANDKGVFHKPLMSWNTRPNPEDQAPMVLIAKIINNLDTYKASEDVAIIDHPAMTLISTKHLAELTKPFPDATTLSL